MYLFLCSCLQVKRQKLENAVEMLPIWAQEHRQWD